MKKTIVAGLSIGLAASCLLAAGSIASAKTVTLTWLCRDWAGEMKWYKDTAANFEKTHPNIKVKVNIVPFDQYDDKLMVQIATGQAPDLWSHIGHSGFMDYKARNLILDLTNYAKVDKFKVDDFFQRALSPYTIGGRLWGLPTGTYSSFTYYNTALFEQNGISPLPTTWNDKNFDWNQMTEFAKKIAKDTNGDGRLDIGGITAAYHFDPETGLAWNWGGDFWPADTYETGYPKKSTINTAPVINAFKAFTDLKLKYKVWGGDFGSNKLGMRVEGSWVFDDLKKVKKVKWDVGVTPAGPAGRVPVLFVDPWVIFKGTKHPKEAWEFLKYVTGTEAQKDWISLTGKMPSRKSLLSTFLKTIPNVDRAEMVSLITESFDIGREAVNHLVVNYRQYDRVLTPIFTKIKDGKIGVEQGLKDADTALTRAIALYGSQKKLGSL